MPWPMTPQRQPPRMLSALCLLLFLGLSQVLSAQPHRVVVGDVPGLVAAVAEANRSGDTTIVLKDGLYALSKVLEISGNRVSLESLAQDPARVTLRGRGMKQGAGNLMVVSGTSVRLSGLTLEQAGNHLIQLRGEADADFFTMTHCVLRDSWEQLFKVSKAVDGEATADFGVVRNNRFEYSAGIGPQYYIGGIDMHGGKGWEITGNTFRNIASPERQVAEHAIHLWSGSGENRVENNLIIDSDRGIGFGMSDKASRGNRAGEIIGNVILHTNSDHPFADVGIGLESSPGTLVANNLILLHHDYPNAIEYRFAATQGVDILGNRTNKAIVARDGGQAALVGNDTGSLLQRALDTMKTGWRAYRPRASALVASKLASVGPFTSEPNYEPKPTSATLAEKYSLTFVGGIRLQAGTFGSSRVAWNTGPMAVSDDGGSLWIAGHAQHYSVGRFSLPDPVNSTKLKRYAMAEVADPFVKIDPEVMEGKSPDRITGMRHIDGALVVNVAEYYDADADNRQTTVVFDDAWNLASRQRGYFRLQGGVHAAGWMSPVPASLQAIFGGSYLAGFASNLPINGRSSMGPSLFIFDPANFFEPGGLSGDVGTRPLIDYPLYNALSDDLRNQSGENKLWTEVSKAVFGFFTPDDEHYLVIGHSGGHQSGVGYKIKQENGYECGGFCAIDYKDVGNYFWLYSLPSILDVHCGRQPPHTPRPVAFGELPVFSLGKQIVGADFDRESGRLYLLIGGADAGQSRYESQPVLLVYTLGALSVNGQNPDKAGLSWRERVESSNCASGS